MSKKVWYQHFIDRIKEKLKEYKNPIFEHEDFTKNRYYCVYQIQENDGSFKRLVFVCSKFQKNIDIYTKELSHVKNNKEGKDNKITN